MSKRLNDIHDLLKIPTPHHFEHTMNTNQGLICNNILHNRSAFVDDPQHPRLLLRGRYSNRVCCYNSPPRLINRCAETSMPINV
jgi:hypothetical protein